ncbi:PucR family transcriptional regulator [Arthrobacter globiformis]|uniref:PucR family transcriptional regulator n=1 Tax=Arthrobacter globiformis TaxID=1665 RepID=UPI00112509A9|nr:helix-turn-helix domain-containing protein [Arthrobacter globiformis]
MVSQSTARRYDPDISRLTSEVVDLIWNELPGYSADMVEKSELIQSVERYVRLTINVLRRGEAPTFGELAIESDLGSRRAKQNVPLESVILAFRATERVLLLDVFSDRHHWPLKLTRHYADLVIDTFDRLSQHTVNSYRETYSVLESLHERAQSDLMDALISGIALHPAQLATWAQMLSVEPGRPYLAVAIATEGDKDPLKALRLRTRFSLALQPAAAGPVLFGETPAAQVGLFSPAGPVARALENLKSTITGLHWEGRLIVGVGTLSDDLPSAGSSCLEALSAADVGRRQERQQTVVTYESVLIDSLLLDRAKTADALVESRLRRLEDHPQLLETLQALVDNDFSQSKTARSLFIHINTVAHRLKKIQTLTGYDPLRLNELLELALAMRYRKLVRGD